MDLKNLMKDIEALSA